MAANERTPLLDSEHSRSNLEAAATSEPVVSHETLPFLEPLLALIEEPDETSVAKIRSELVEWNLAADIILAYEILSLGIVLRRHGSIFTTSKDLNDIYNSRIIQKKRINATASLLVRTWDRFGNERGSEEPTRVFYQPIPLNARQSLRVIDLLCDDQVAELLVPHQFTRICLESLWRLPIWQKQTNVSQIHPISKLGSFSTPRVIYATALVFHLIFLSIIANYTLFPPFNRITPDWREILILLFSLSNYFQPVSVTSITSAGISLATAVTLYQRIGPESIIPSILLLGFFILLLQLHFVGRGYSPTPLLVFPPASILPLSTYVELTIFKALIPAISFFLPLLLFSSFMLSLSLVDFSLFLSRFTDIYYTSLDASPLETRYLYFLTFSLSLLWMLFSTIGLLSAWPAWDRETPFRKWERYGEVTAFHATLKLTRAIAQYSSQDFFPSPFNLLHVVCVRVPRTVFQKSESLRAIENLLWEIGVATPGFLVAGFWLWK
ncbi:hypothetical protein SISNIDRAFT_454572 [Sistotremastrum niveocremeum HHB9708]|uniref:Uncharacterized protein n=1 Tax=Sistotremastrum niveocremeum HHB9708 TaxID=1314777 RepID=A0A164UNH2_9AGAM|nr:hypothetical protein SISNIDRAFT_454572 [Sistotremastrum niveocremeum HHB9708]